MHEFYFTSLSHVKSSSIFSVRVETPATSQLDMLAVVLGRFEGGFDPSMLVKSPPLVVSLNVSLITRE